ncbi:MAG: nucleoside 2-deoxyribosyltransferase [Candidatus Micrarchaeota archaeon]
MIKIYFAGSIRGGRNDSEIQSQLIQHLAKFGQVLTEHVGDKYLGNLGEVKTSDNFIYSRDVAWIKESNVVVAEVSTPSLGVGYEIGNAERLGKNIMFIPKPARQALVGHDCGKPKCKSRQVRKARRCNKAH